MGLARPTCLIATQPRSLLQRQVRWHCQSLKAKGLLERVEDERGVWQLTEAGRQKLRKARSGVSVLAFDTKLGIAIWGDAHRVFSAWGGRRRREEAARVQRRRA